MGLTTFNEKKEYVYIHEILNPFILWFFIGTIVTCFGSCFLVVVKDKVIRIIFPPVNLLWWFGLAMAKL